MKVDQPQPIAMLKNAALKTTAVRLGVLDVLGKSKKSMDVPAILAKMPPYTGVVTVYRTLNTFTRKGLVHRIRGDDRSWQYAIGDSLRTSEHQHPHFFCERCGKVECLSQANIPENLGRTLGVSKNYVIHKQEVVLHGICPSCR